MAWLRNARRRPCDWQASEGPMPETRKAPAGCSAASTAATHAAVHIIFLNYSLNFRQILHF